MNALYIVGCFTYAGGKGEEQAEGLKYVVQYIEKISQKTVIGATGDSEATSQKALNILVRWLGTRREEEIGFKIDDIVKPDMLTRIEEENSEQIDDINGDLVENAEMRDAFEDDWLAKFELAVKDICENGPKSPKTSIFSIPLVFASSFAPAATLSPNNDPTNASTDSATSAGLKMQWLGSWPDLV